MNHLRNFALVAHIDHGKSTLADRILEICGAVNKDHADQLLDSLELEREHGVTIKLKAVRLSYQSRYILNLIDTPGHADFAYEVSRSLASVEGVVLIVDATQGVQAQTLGHFNLALEAGLVIIPVINKIDSPQAAIDKTIDQLVELGFKEDEIIKVSAKTGHNVDLVIEAIVKLVPPPSFLNQQTAALVFDSTLDPHRGVVVTVRLVGGKIKVGDEVLFIASRSRARVLQLGFVTPRPVFVNELNNGEIGFVVTDMKEPTKVRIGDTLTLFHSPAAALPGYREPKPVVFLSFYPVNDSEFIKLKESLERLRLQDASLQLTPEISAHFGRGFRLGFLGVFHAQITQERLEREYGVEVIAVAPAVSLEVDGKFINKPSDFNPACKVVREPYAQVTIIVPLQYYGPVCQLIYDQRGRDLTSEQFGNTYKIIAKVPLLEIVRGFYERLKSLTAGFASFDFETIGYFEADLVKLDVLVNRQPVENLAEIVPRSQSHQAARLLASKLKEVIPRHQFPVSIQVAIGSRIIASETIPAYRKDVTAKLYGGDVTRKMKLLEKQKRGKVRMKKIGKVVIPQEAFLTVFQLKDKH